MEAKQKKPIIGLGHYRLVNSIVMDEQLALFDAEQLKQIYLFCDGVITLDDDELKDAFLRIQANINAEIADIKSRITQAQMTEQLASIDKLAQERDSIAELQAIYEEHDQVKRFINEMIQDQEVALQVKAKIEEMVEKGSYRPPQNPIVKSEEPEPVKKTTKKKKIIKKVEEEQTDKSKEPEEAKQPEQVPEPEATKQPEQVPEPEETKQPEQVPKPEETKQPEKPQEIEKPNEVELPEQADQVEPVTSKKVEKPEATPKQHEVVIEEQNSSSDSEKPSGWRKIFGIFKKSDE